MPFDWLVVSHIMDVDPSHAAQGQSISLEKTRRPMFTAEEAHTLLDSIPEMRSVKLKGGNLIDPDGVHLRARRAGIAMKVED
jgi:hypothetical protein